MFTDEELDTLNSAIEIVSRYIDKGLVDRDALNSFERMICLLYTSPSPRDRG